MESCSTEESERAGEIQYRASTLAAFDICCSQTKTFLCETGDGGRFQVSRDLLLLFSPSLRELYENLPSHPSRADDIPVLMLPDFNAVSVLRLVKLITSGEAEGFRNHFEDKDIIELSKLLNIGIEELHVKGGSQTSSPGAQSRAPTFPRPITVETTATIVKKEAENEIPNENPEEQLISNEDGRQIEETQVNNDTAPTIQNGSQLMITFDDEASELHEVAKPKSPIPVKPKKTFNCGICQHKSYKTANQLLSHYIGTHFATEISTFIDNGACKICGKSFEMNGKVELHVGIQHKKIIEILRPKNLWFGDDAVASRSSPIPEATIDNAEVKTPSKNGRAKAKKSIINSNNSIKNSPSFKNQEKDVIGGTSPVTAKTQDSNSGSKGSCSMSNELSGKMFQSPSPIKMQRISSDNNNCNFDMKCELCGKELKTHNQLEVHMVMHFSKEVESRVNSLMTSDLDCAVCGDSFKKKGHLISHLGAKHGYINEILREKQLSVLPCTVNSTYSAAKQRTLSRIKKEREETTSGGINSNEDLRRELMDDHMSLLNEQATTDRILNKYKDKIELEG